MGRLDQLGGVRSEIQRAIIKRFAASLFLGSCTMVAYYSALPETGVMRSVLIIVWSVMLSAPVLFSSVLGRTIENSLARLDAGVAGLNASDRVNFVDAAVTIASLSWFAGLTVVSAALGLFSSVVLVVPSQIVLVLVLSWGAAGVVYRVNKSGSPFAQFALGGTLLIATSGLTVVELASASHGTFVCAERGWAIIMGGVALAASLVRLATTALANRSK